jgi:hypothetical protein
MYQSSLERKPLKLIDPFRGGATFGDGRSSARERLDNQL